MSKHTMKMTGPPGSIQIWKCSHCGHEVQSMHSGWEGGEYLVPQPRHPCPGQVLSLPEARAILAYIETLERPFGLDMWRKYGLGADHASMNQAALFTQQHPQVGAALKKLQEAADE